MSEWENVWNSNNEYILQRKWNGSISDYNFRVKRNLLNLPKVEIIHLLSLVDLTDEQRTLILLGYTHQFIIGSINENVRQPSQSLDTLQIDIYYLMKAERILTRMKHEVARTMNKWIA